MEEEFLSPRASNSCSVTAIVSFFHLLPHLHPQDKLAVKPCVAAAELAQLQAEVEQGWVLVQHPVLVEDCQHHLPDCGGSISNLRRHNFRYLGHIFF